MTRGKKDTGPQRELSLGTSLGACTPQQMEEILKVAESSEPETLIFAACMMICSLEQERPLHKGVWQRPLDALASCGHPAAEAVLLHMVQHAQNARIQIEATRRLGKGISPGTRTVLYGLAKEGSCRGRGFAQETLGPDHMRIAALEALGAVSKPTDADGTAVLDAIKSEVEQNKDSGVFRAGTVALSRLCKPHHLAEIVQLADVCRIPAMALRLLAACRSLSMSVLRKQQAILSTILCRSLGDLDEQRDGELLNELCDLVPKITDSGLIARLADACTGQSLERGRGRIAAAALRAYPKQDEHLASAYLRFAEYEGNIRPGSCGITGVGACVKAGHAQEVADRVVSQSSRGYQELMRSNLLPEVFGTVANAVRQVCEALGRIDDADRRNRCARGCCEGIIRLAIADDEQGAVFGKLEEIRANATRRNGEAPPAARIAAILAEADPKRDSLAILARKICGPASAVEGSGALSLARCLLQPADDLGRAFLKRLLAAACAVTLDRPGSLAKEALLSTIEESIGAEYSETLKGIGRVGVVADRKLNRYAMDVLRRRQIAFRETAQAALTRCGTAPDAVFVLDSLAEQGDVDSTRLLAEATGYHATSVDMTNEVRAHAVRLLADLLGGKADGIPSAEREKALDAIHSRFEDSTNVRLAAYEAAQQLASPRSILALRSRLSTERSPVAQKAIGGALAETKKRLLNSIPPPDGIAALIIWLKNLGNLADPEVAEFAASLLFPPHADPSVRVAALDCIGKAGDRGMISKLDAFLEDTSPSGAVLTAARHAKATLQGRKDLSFIQALEQLFPLGSPVLDLSVNYDDMLGPRKLASVTTGLIAMTEQWEAGHWGDFVTRTDAVCDVLCKRLYEMQWAAMGLEKEKSRVLASKDYGDRLYVSEFKDTFRRIQPLMLSIHNMRGDAGVAHLENVSGAGGTPIGRTEAELARQQFMSLFAAWVDQVSKKERQAESLPGNPHESN